MRTSAATLADGIVPAMGIMIDGVSNGNWHITPEPDEDAVELAFEVRGRRFVAQLRTAELAAVEKLLTELPNARSGSSSGQIDLSQEFVRVIGHDPFVEQKVDRWPWYRKLLRQR